MKFYLTSRNLESGGIRGGGNKERFISSRRDCDGYVDLSARFINVDGDEDFVYHRSGYPLAAWANQSHKH